MDWNLNPNHLYIGRSEEHHGLEGAVESKWHNPYLLRDYSREDSLRKYEERVRNSEELFNAIGELEGLELGCWCKPIPCHGDVLAKLFRELFINESNERPPQHLRFGLSVLLSNRTRHHLQHLNR